MTADERFAACLAETELYEGGYAHDPFDPGGSTFRGVTQRTYDAWRRQTNSYLRDVRQASDSEIAAIYRTQYWNTVRGDELPPGVDLVLFDIAVNAGPVRAIKFLQQALGVFGDGQFGLETMSALTRCADKRGLIVEICGARLSFWHALSTWWRFGRGWASRGGGIEEKALAMAAKN